MAGHVFEMALVESLSRLGYAALADELGVRDDAVRDWAEGRSAPVPWQRREVYRLSQGGKPFGALIDACPPGDARQSLRHLHRTLTGQLAGDESVEAAACVANLRDMCRMLGPAGDAARILLGLVGESTLAMEGHR